MTRLSRPALALLGALGVGAWADACPRPAPAAAATCAPVQADASAPVRAEGLAGAFRLTLVATGGPRAGQSVSGTLRLEAFGARPAPLPVPAGYRFPLFGAAEVDVQAVGAVTPGAVDQLDAARPGVLVMETARPDAPAEVMLRLGADANGAGPARFDGAFMALTLTATTSNGFAGRWQSGTGTDRASGHFCAERTGGAGS